MKLDRKRYETEEDAILREEKERLKLVSSTQRVEDMRRLMSTDWGRRETYKLLWQGFRLPGQMVSNTNGSLQSYQLGRSDALREFDDVIRLHFNDEWKVMLEENKHKFETND